jgi:hypothetical protein
MICFFQTDSIYHTNVGDGGTAGGIKAEGGVRNRVGAALREAAEASREAASMAWRRGRQGRGRRWGLGTTTGALSAASREAAAQRAENLGSLMAQTKISPRLGFCVGEVTPLIPNSAADTKNMIYGIG